MKAYECIVDDGKNVFKANVVAKNKKDLVSIYGGNGKFISIKDVSNNYFANVGNYEEVENAIEKLRTVLFNAGYGEMERTIICSLLGEFLENRK